MNTGIKLYIKQSISSEEVRFHRQRARMFKCFASTFLWFIVLYFFIKSILISSSFTFSFWIIKNNVCDTEIWTIHFCLFQKNINAGHVLFENFSPDNTLKIGLILKETIFFNHMTREGFLINSKTFCFTQFSLNHAKSYLIM